MFPELLIFDMDGLLFDTERMFMNLRAKVLEKYGYVHREEDYLKTVGVSGKNLTLILKEIYDENYPKDAVSNETRLLQREEIQKNGVPVKPGIPLLLQWAEEKKIPCCVATSTQRQYALFMIEKSGLLPFFSFIIAGDDVSNSKPDPDIFLTACKKGGTKPQNALVLEDSENGVLAAFRGGIPVLCIPDLKQPSEEIASKAAAVLQSADEAVSWILRHQPHTSSCTL